MTCTKSAFGHKTNFSCSQEISSFYGKGWGETPPICLRKGEGTWNNNSEGKGVMNSATLDLPNPGLGVHREMKRLVSVLQLPLMMTYNSHLSNKHESSEHDD